LLSKPRVLVSSVPCIEVKIREVIMALEQAGWVLVATRGSHRQFKHPNRPGRVTVAGKPSDDLAPGTLKSIARQSGVPLP
jgi:predicted RNA binding protein YcfA (HicA-like mRNA interferase family)